MLSIAGYDPSAGAGVLADIQTFTSLGVQGMAATTCVTYQDEDQVYGIDWLSFEQIQRQLSPILSKYNVSFVKIGLIESIERMSEIVDLVLDHKPNTKVIWDPIVSSSSGFEILAENQEVLQLTIPKLFLATPNLPEYKWLKEQNVTHETNILIKGGHSLTDDVSDLLIWKSKEYIIEGKKKKKLDKHGSGCILSSAILARLALGHNLFDACIAAKAYINSYLTTSTTKLGKHHLVSI